LISTALLALSLSGAAVAAQPAHTVPQANVAPATIIVNHCDETATAPCSLETSTAGNTEAAPAANQHKPVQPEPATPVPEPQTFIMLMLGLVVLGVASRRNSSSEKFSD
jgi:hypothetical protein